MPSFAIDHKRLCLLVFLLVIPVFCLSGQALVTDYTVPGTPYATLQELRQAVVLAPGDSIILAGDDSSLTDSFIFDAGAVTITGSGTITPNASAYLFAKIISGAITINGTGEGLVFSAFDRLSAITINAGSLTLSGTNTFEKNAAG